MHSPKTTTARSEKRYIIKIAYDDAVTKTTTARSEKRYIIKIAYDDAVTKNNNC